MTTLTVTRLTVPPTRRLRFTRRGRALLVLTVMALLVAAGLTLGRGAGQAAGGGRPAGHELTVRPGDTLWTVAARVAPHQDPRLVVAKLEAVNRLAGPALVAGQQLLVPSFG